MIGQPFIFFYFSTDYILCIAKVGFGILHQWENQIEFLYNIDFQLFWHYSAGIGRTGTYIALDSLHHGGRKSGRVNVAEYVKTMRANRMNMIQTYVRKVKKMWLMDWLTNRLINWLINLFFVMFWVIVHLFWNSEMHTHKAKFVWITNRWHIISISLK